MLVIVSILIGCVFLAVHCGKKEEAFPQILLGKWTTGSERYQDRYIEFRPGLMIFGTGNGIPNIFFIRSVEQTQNGPGKEYTFMCTNKVDTEFIFVFLVEGDGDSLTLRLKNPHEVVWKKAADPKD